MLPQATARCQVRSSPFEFAELYFLRIIVVKLMLEVPNARASPGQVIFVTDILIFDYVPSSSIAPPLTSRQLDV